MLYNVFRIVNSDNIWLQKRRIEMADVMENVKVDPIAEAAVVELIANVFNGVGYMDADTVRHNIELATEGGLSKSDRAIKVELANYLLSHFSLIFVGLIVNAEFRDTFKEAVSVEIALDGKSNEFVQKIRREMNEGEYLGESKGSFVINLSRYNDSIYKKLNGKLSLSFSKITQFDDTVSMLIDELTEDDKISIGFCASNFMYLYRAFAKNLLFANYVKTVVSNVQGTLGIEW